MDFIIDAIVEWLKGLLVDGIMGNLDGLFNNVNEQVGGIASQVGTCLLYTSREGAEGLGFILLLLFYRRNGGKNSETTFSLYYCGMERGAGY